MNIKDKYMKKFYFDVELLSENKKFYGTMTSFGNSVDQAMSSLKNFLDDALSDDIIYAISECGQ